MDTIEGGRRREILDSFRAHGHARSAREVADEHGLHINTARFHLDALVRQGSLRREAGRSSGPGRPRANYLLVQGMDRTGPRSYQLLSKILLSHLAHDQNPAAAAARAGQTWGRYLVPPPAPGQKLSIEEALTRLTELLADVGFDPQVSTGAGPDFEIRLRHCPFLELAETHRDLICTLHLGLLTGALEQLDTSLQARALLPFVDPNTCLAHLASPDHGQESGA